MTEHTREQVRDILRTEAELIDACIELGAIAERSGWCTWQLACTLTGREIDGLTIGELRQLAREVAA